MVIIFKENVVCSKASKIYKMTRDPAILFLTGNIYFPNFHSFSEGIVLRMSIWTRRVVLKTVRADKFISTLKCNSLQNGSDMNKAAVSLPEYGICASTSEE